MGIKSTEVFKSELDLIKDKEFKHHVINIIEGLPDYILEIPSSSTGKYHPSDEINKDGMQRHAKRCALLSKDMVLIDNFYSPYLDILIAGSIVHDMLKNGYLKSDSSYEKYTQDNHPIFIFDYIMKYLTESNTNFESASTETSLILLSVICLFHMGQWTPKEAKERFKQCFNRNCLTYEEGKLSEMMHLIDYVVSRRNLFDIMNPSFFDKERLENDAKFLQPKKQAEKFFVKDMNKPKE